MSKPREYSYLAVAPDGKRLATIFLEDGKIDLWVYDFSRDTLAKLHSGGQELYPVWTPQGDFVVSSNGPSMRWSPSDGSSGGEAGLKAESGVLNVWSFSKAGDRLAYSGDGKTWTVPVERTPEGLRFGKKAPLLEGSGVPALSPDGRFLAYTSQESGRTEIYVRPLLSTPDGVRVASSGKRQISSEGGQYPQWSPSGRELFYQGTDRRIWVASFNVTGDQFVPDKARQWSQVQSSALGNTPGYSLSPDGKRAAMILDADAAPKPETHIRVLFNLPDELRRREAFAKPK